MHAAEFVHQVLLGSLGAKLVVVGTNFRFGRNREGDVSVLRHEGIRHGFQVDAVELLRGEGTTVSSSAIRSLLSAGDVEDVEHALGRPFELRGLVVAGDGRGRGIGFPTANLSFSDELAVPARGVYAVLVKVGDRLGSGCRERRRPPDLRRRASSPLKSTFWTLMTISTAKPWV